jgi:hypothetical protein
LEFLGVGGAGKKSGEVVLESRWGENEDGMGRGAAILSLELPKLIGTLDHLTEQ